MTGLLLAATSFAQKDTGKDSLLRERAVKLFIECFYCDINYIRQEIPYVNYVRDVKEAQVYLLETSR